MFRLIRHNQVTLTMIWKMSAFINVQFDIQISGVMGQLFLVVHYEKLDNPWRACRFELTNKESLTVLCFCCKAHKKRLEQERRVGTNTRLLLVFLFTF